MARLRRAHAAFREARLELAEHDVGGVQHVAGRDVALVIIVAVGRQIAGREENIGHAAASNAIGDG